jgi:hypothetical protein
MLGLLTLIEIDVHLTWVECDVGDHTLIKEWAAEYQSQKKFLQDKQSYII